MNKITSQSLRMALTALTSVCFFTTTHLPYQNELISGIAFALVIGSLILEQVFPYDQSWNNTQNDVGGDVAMTILVFVILESILMAMTPFSLLMLLGGYGGNSTELPLWAEIIAVGLLVELGAYLSHRANHNFARLWPLHAMHHSPERLYTLNNFRFHPLNHVFNHLFLIVPPLLLGFSAQSILGYTAITLPILLLQHSNVKFQFGWFNTILNTNQVHRWHHSSEEQHHICNLRRATVLFDRLFGTYYAAGPDSAPTAVDLSTSGQPYPAGRRLLAQLCYPFTHQCCSKPTT